MTSCGCERCRPDDPDPRTTQRYMRECFVRHVVKLKKPARQEFYRGFLAKKGQPALDALIADVRAEYQRQQHDRKECA